MYDRTHSSHFEGRLQMIHEILKSCCLLNTRFQDQLAVVVSKYGEFSFSPRNIFVTVNHLLAAPICLNYTNYFVTLMYGFCEGCTTFL